METAEIYTFKIDAFTPETIPMARLAEYMVCLATLLGEKERVHFRDVKKGCVQLCSVVEREAAPKVAENIGKAVSGEATENTDANKRINEMLRMDNASAQLMRGETNILLFPGIKAPRPQRLGPFTQSIERDGVLLRIGGVDKSAHAIIADGDGNTWSFETSRELARRLAPHLFGNPIRLFGKCRCYRDEEGQWQYDAFKANDFDTLNDVSLAETVTTIRAMTVGTWEENAHETLLAMRSDEKSEAG